MARYGVYEAGKFLNEYKTKNLDGLRSWVVADYGNGRKRRILDIHTENGFTGQIAVGGGLAPIWRKFHANGHLTVCGIDRRNGSLKTDRRV